MLRLVRYIVVRFQTSRGDSWLFLLLVLYNVFVLRGMFQSVLDIISANLESKLVINQVSPMNSGMTPVDHVQRSISARKLCNYDEPCH